MPESAEHDGERGKLLLLQWDSFPRCCAVLCCVERLLLIPLETASLLKPASQPSAGRIQEVSVQTTWKCNRQRRSKVTTLTLWIQHVLFMHACYNGCHVDLWITSSLITLCDIENMIQLYTFPLTLYSTECMKDVYGQHKQMWHAAFIHSTPCFCCAVEACPGGIFMA